MSGVVGAETDTGVIAEPSASLRAVIQRLSEASVRRRWEAHRDVAWDAPEHAVVADDPRWRAEAEWDPLARSTWYRDQSPDARSALGLLRHTQMLKAGIEFEATLAQGLLRFAARLPNGHPGIRYVYHEVAEEAQHSMMFQEFIDRSGCDPAPASDESRAEFHKITGFADSSPVLLFIAGLTGEEAFDHLQRRLVRSPSTPPLIRRISTIHATEEARHVSFARSVLRDLVPRLSRRDVRALRYQVPLLVDWTATHVLSSFGAIRADSVLPDGVDPPCESGESATARADLRRRAMARVVSLCDELGLVDARAGAVWATLR
jgi:hypothetical protein